MSLDDKVIDSALDRAFAKADGVEPPAGSEKPTKMPEMADKSPATDKVSKKTDLIEDKAYLDASQKIAKDIKTDAKPKLKLKADKKDDAASIEPTEDLSDQEASADTSAIEPTAQVETIPAPSYWTPESKAIFNSATPELQKAIAAESLKVQQQATRLANDANKGKLYEQRVQEVFGPYELRLKAEGVRDWSEAAQRLLAWNEIFEKDVYTGITDLMHKNNLTPYDFINGQTGQPHQVSSDPRVDEALKAANEAKALLTQYQTQTQEQKTQTLNHEINTFKVGKDSRGQVRSSFAQMYAPQIDQVYQIIVKDSPHVSIGEALDSAYEYVLAEASKALGVTAAPPKPPAKTPEQVKADAQKAKAAASSVTGAPSTGAPHVKAKAKTIDEAIDRAFEKAGY